MYEDEFLQIVNEIISNRKYLRLQEEKHHHNTNRYKHMLDVSYMTYKFCKNRNLDYKSATKAAVLHDFYFDDDFKNDNNAKKILKHPEIAIKNSEEICDLTEKEKNIIASHMFPIGGKLPRYKESIVVDVIDDIVSAKERLNGDFKKIKYAIKVGMVLIIGLLGIYK